MSQGVEIELSEQDPPADSSDEEVPSPFAALLRYGRQLLPVVIAALMILSAMLLIDRVRFLAGFNHEFSGSGLFQVTHCETVNGDEGKWRCDGALTVDGRLEEIPSILITSQASLTSGRPYVGEQVEVFYRSGDSSTVYPRSARLGELTRLYLQLVPMLLLAAGSLLWSLGWLSAALAGTRRPSDQIIVIERGRALQPAWAASDAGFGPLRISSVRSLKRRGTAWIVAGVVLTIAVALLGRLALGSLGFP